MAPQDKVTFLFRTKEGRFFAQHRGIPGGEPSEHMDRNWVEPLSEIEAIPLYWELSEQLISFEKAFPQTPSYRFPYQKGDQ